MKQFQAFIITFVITTSVALCQSVFNPSSGYSEGSANQLRFNYQRYEGLIDGDSVIITLTKYNKIAKIEIDFIKEKYQLISTTNVIKPKSFYNDEKYSFVLSKFNPAKSSKPIKTNIKLKCNLDERILTGEMKFPDNKTAKLNAKIKFPEGTARISFIQFQKNFNSFSQNALSTEIVVPIIRTDDSVQSFRINRTIFNILVGNQIDKYKTNSEDEESIKYYSRGFIKNLNKEQAQKIKTYDDYINKVIYADYIESINSNDKYEQKIKKKYSELDTMNLLESEKEDIRSAELYNYSTYSMSWDYTVSIEPILNSNNLLTLANYESEYTGGAHGGSSVDFINLDIKNSNKLEIKDIFSKGFHSKLTKITKKRFLAQTTKRKDEALNDFAGGYYYPNNFAITKYGLYFHYREYEIGCYAEGMVDIFVPYGDLMELIPKESPIYELAKEHSFEKVKNEKKRDKK